MRVLITGAGGQVGQALADASPNPRQMVRTTRAELDITDAAAVAAFTKDAKPDLIINAAAFTAVDKAEREPERAREVNEYGARNLAEVAASSGARMIQISTDFVFDGSSSVPYAPDSSPAALGVYGATKLSGERAVLNSLPQNSIVLRTAWVYAAEGRNFVNTMLRVMRDKQTVRVVADQIGTPTSAASIAHAIWALSASPDCHGTYHWTDAGVASWYDFAVAIAEEATANGLLSAPVEVTAIASEDYPTPARRPGYSVLDTRSTVKAIGTIPQHWRTNLRSVLGEIERG